MSEAQVDVEREAGASQLGHHRDRRRVPRPASLTERLRVRLARARLDHDFAASCSAESSRLHTLRADQLARGEFRSRLAAGLRRVVTDAAEPCSVLTAVPYRRGPVLVYLRQSEVMSCADGLLGLADRLDDSAPINPGGVARARLLLTDATGPLYHSHPKRELGEAIWWIADDLALPVREPAVR